MSARVSGLRHAWHLAQFTEWAVSSAPFLVATLGFKGPQSEWLLDPPVTLRRVARLCPLLSETLNPVIATHASVCRLHCEVLLAPSARTLHSSASGLES